MSQRSSTTASVAIALVGAALFSFSLYGFSTHEITLRRSRGIPSEYRVNRSREVTFTGWSADVVRLGFATLGVVLISHAFCPDRRTAVRYNVIGLVAWLGMSSVCIAWWVLRS